MNNAMTLAVDDKAAREYLLTRRSDAEALVAQDIGKLAYVSVWKQLGVDGVVVGDVLCATTLCAVAYILAKWW